VVSTPVDPSSTFHLPKLLGPKLDVGREIEDVPGLISILAARNKWISCERTEYRDFKYYFGSRTMSLTSYVIWAFAKFGL
jgi:hypothetical protein